MVDRRRLGRPVDAALWHNRVTTGQANSQPRGAERTQPAAIDTDDFGSRVPDTRNAFEGRLEAGRKIETALVESLNAELPIVRATRRLLDQQGYHHRSEHEVAHARAEVIKTHPHWWRRYVAAQVQLGNTQCLEGVAGHWADLVVEALFRIRASTADEQNLLNQWIERYGVHRSALDRGLRLADAGTQTNLRLGRRNGGRSRAKQKPGETQARNQRMEADFIVAVTHDGFKRADALKLVAGKENLSLAQAQRILKPLTLMKGIAAITKGTTRHRGVSGNVVRRA